MKQIYCCRYHYNRCKKRSSFVDASQTKQKRQIKTMNSILVKDWTRLLNNERQIINLVNLRVKLNFINYVYVMQWELQFTFVILSTLSFLNDDDRYCYDVYKLIYHLINSWSQHQECTILFYLIEYINSNLMLDMSMLAKQDILINSKMQNWRFKIANNKLKIINFKKFVLDFVKYNTIYVIVCVGVTKAPNKKLTKFEISKKLRDLKDVCDNKLIKILLKLKRENHVIELQDNKELSFMFLYNLSQNELTILR